MTLKKKRKQKTKRSQRKTEDKFSLEFPCELMFST